MDRLRSRIWIMIVGLSIRGINLRQIIEPPCRRIAGVKAMPITIKDFREITFRENLNQDRTKGNGVSIREKLTFWAIGRPWTIKYKTS